MPAKRKPTPAPARPGPGRPAVPGIDRRQSRSITLPASVWARLEYVTASAGLGSLSSLVETYLTTPAHLQKTKLPTGFPDLDNPRPPAIIYNPAHLPKK